LTRSLAFLKVSLIGSMKKKKQKLPKKTLQSQ
jgi:hypothetical protein